MTEKETKTKDFELEERFKKIKKCLGGSNIKIMSKIGMEDYLLSAYMNGRCQPTTSSLKKIAKLGINLHWLITGEGEMFTK